MGERILAIHREDVRLALGMLEEAVHGRAGVDHRSVDSVPWRLCAHHGTLGSHDIFGQVLDDGAYDGWHLAEKDEFITEDEVAFMEATMRLESLTVDIVRYEGTKHGFCEPDGDSFDPQAFEKAWATTLGWLAERLLA